MTTNAIPTAAIPSVSRKQNAELVNKMESKMVQLKALSIIISGEGLEHLHSHNDEIQNNVLWLAADLAAEIQELYQEAFVRA